MRCKKRLTGGNSCSIMDLQEIPLVLRVERWFTLRGWDRRSILLCLSKVFQSTPGSLRLWLLCVQRSICPVLRWSVRQAEYWNECLSGSSLLGDHMDSDSFHTPFNCHALIVINAWQFVKWLNDIFSQFPKTFFCKQIVAGLSPMFKTELLCKEGLFWRFTRLCVPRQWDICCR